MGHHALGAGNVAVIAVLQRKPVYQLRTGGEVCC